jgi:MYXO-CTERM domain-containing protein
MRSRFVRSGMLALFVAGGVFALGWGEKDARACGGLFCNRPPPNPFDPLPVAQSGENIVFSVATDAATGESTVKAHIQIFYTGPADKFSWVVPVDSAPTVGVGSDLMFTQVAARTAPTFKVNWKVDGTCKPEPYGPSFDASASSFGGSSGSGGSTAGPATVDVLFRGAVGPFDAAVIHSISSVDLRDWLTTNGYFVSDQSVVIIDDYVTENKYFVALKLLNGKDVLSIQPVVLTFKGTEPCVPLKLTAIAALKDLQVNLWVLGQSRAVPKNYLELKVNEVRLDWLGGARNYSDLVKKAADEVGGNAFVAEYAGTARIMDGQIYQNGRFDLAALRASATPPVYLQQVVNQRLTAFAQTLGVLRANIPEPQSLKDRGVTEAQFYANNALYWQSNQAEFAPFDPNKLTDEIEAAIVTPLKDGQAAFDAHPYLTRLATYISPDEMTRDPLFIFNSDLPPVSNVHTAEARWMCGNQEYRQCEAPVRLILPDQTMIWFQHQAVQAGQSSCNTPLDRGALDLLPAASGAWQRAEAGEGQPVMNNGPMVATKVAEHNSTANPAQSTNYICGCNHAGKAGPYGAAALLALGLGLAVRRRRR